MTESVWKGFKRIDFEFEGMEARIVFPEKPNKYKNWVIKTEYFGAFPAFQTEMLKRGWHLVYLKNQTRWCHDEDIERKKRFADFVIEKYGLYKKCLPVGMSCGGMIAVKFAAKYPQYVSALYLDAPVMNLLSCPAGVGKAGDTMLGELTQGLGMTLIDLMSYREHPIDKIPALIENKIPVFMVYGAIDQVVPYDENGEILEKKYRENGIEIHVVGKPECDHHPHGLTDNTPIIEFAEKYAL